MTAEETTVAQQAAAEVKPMPKGAGFGAGPSSSPIGGNVLSPFYSSAFFVPYSGAQTFTALTGNGLMGTANGLSGTYWGLPFCRAIPRRKRGLADVTHSWYPISRGLRQTQWTFDCQIHQLTNPDMPVESNFTAANSFGGFQMYLTLGALANYPAVDTVQYYFWCPSVFLEEASHTLDLTTDPVHPVHNDIVVRSNGPAFFLPTDSNGSPSPISAFLTYITGLGWGF